MPQTHFLRDIPTDKFTTPSSLTYHYIHVLPSLPQPQHQQPPKPTILLLHGFPSIPHDFHHQIIHLSSLGHGILAPYLLGYSPTSTPRDQNAYRLKSMSHDIISLLDHLNLTSPIPAVGHDWGATLLSRLEYYHPTRFSKLAYLTIAPTPFGASFDLDKVNTMTKQFLGYEGFGYQKFLMDDPERAANLLEGNHNRMEMLMFAENSTDLFREYFARLGGLEKWLTGDQQAEKMDGVSQELSGIRKETFSPAGKHSSRPDVFGAGYGGSIMWYVGLNEDLNVEDEKTEKSDWETYKTDKDVLVVLSNKDPIASPDSQMGMAEGCVKSVKHQLRVERLDCGHFVTLEQPVELSRILGGFFEEG